MSEQSNITSTSEQDEIEYRDIPDHPGYCAGSDGSIWSCRKSVRVSGRRGGSVAGMTADWHRLKTALASRDKRQMVRLCPDKKSYYVHRLVLLAFAGPCPEGMEGCHNDGNRLNNVPGNLRWDTRKSNVADTRRHGNFNQGSRCSYAKITEDDVVEIRRLYAAGNTSYQKIATRFKIDFTGVYRIVKRRSWKHVK